MIIPYFKFANTKGDRTWWLRVITAKETYKVHQLFAITITEPFENPDAKIIKFIIGPFCFGLGWKTK